MDISLNLNGMKIISDIADEDFSKVKVGQQFLIIEEKEDEKYEFKYNNIHVAFLVDIILDSIYSIEAIDNRVDPCWERIEQDEIGDGTDNEDYEYPEDQYKLYNIDYRGENYSRQFLVLDSKEEIKIELEKAREYEIDLEESSDTNSDTRHINVLKNMSRKYINVDRIVNYDKKEVDFYMSMPLGDNYLCFNIHHIIDTSRYYWHKNENIYLVNKDFTKYCDLSIIGDIFPKLEKLDCTKYSSDFRKFIDVYRFASNYDTEEYMEAPYSGGILTVFKAFEGISFTPNYELEKYFKQVFEDPSMEFVAHLSSKNAFYHHSNVLCKWNSELGGRIRDKPPELLNAIRKANNVVAYLKHEILIDIYTGEPIKNEKYDFEIAYKDAGGLILNIGNKNDSHKRKEHYIVLDGMYMQAQRNEEKEIYDRIEILRKLEEPPIVQA